MGFLLQMPPQHFLLVHAVTPLPSDPDLNERFVVSNTVPLLESGNIMLARVRSALNELLIRVKPCTKV